MGRWRRSGPRPPALPAAVVVLTVMAVAAGCTLRARPEPAPTSRAREPPP